MEKAKANNTERKRRPLAAKRAGGTVINVVFGVAVLGLLVLACWFVVKGLGQATNQYTGAMIGARRDALRIACLTNLRIIGQNLQIYAMSNEGFPESDEELRQWSGNSRMFRCPDPNGGEYIYIPGQSGDMPGSNIIVFEPNAVHDGLCCALRLDGKVEMLPPEQLRQAIIQTQDNMQSHRR
ncbi:MAG: hypothetical protein JW720_09170 [Sedimentisphaerales bacterium]|nr:hypothetical protein [Sedimentisphaerales bacterium]